MCIISDLQAFNADREPERLALKYQKMRASPFVFLRGTCHLFYQQLPSDSWLDNTPATWLSGDLHLENFGSYKGDNRQGYFDVNDFDEAVLAPCTWDVVRFVTSVLVGAQDLSLTQAESKELASVFLDSYAAALANGKALWVERETAEGLVKDLLDSQRGRQRADFLDSRTLCHHGKQRHITIGTGKALAVTDDQRQQVTAFMDAFSRSEQNPEFYRVLDVARRIAGTGSLGIDRYVVLVEGKGSPDGNYLLDLKQSVASSLTPFLKHAQPTWQSEAHRVVALQQRCQAVPMAFLHPVMMDGKPFVLRALQPSEDRVDLVSVHGAGHQLERVLKTMGELVAWGQLRSGGRQGSAIADELIDFAQQPSWKTELLAVAQESCQKTQQSWHEFVQAYDDGLLIFRG